MTVDGITVMKIAHLARLRIEPDQVEPFKAELNRILEWIEQLDEVNIDQVQCMTGVCHEGMRQRDDEVTDGNYADQIVANAPESEFNMFAVPKVVE